MTVFYSGSTDCDCTGKQIVGRRALVEFEGPLESVVVSAKVDTGAYTGGLHAEGIEERDGQLYFYPASSSSQVSVSNFRQKWVRASNGQKETRYVIVVPARINGRRLELELTLAERSHMRHELLIGRKNLRAKFIVDVSL